MSLIRQSHRYDHGTLSLSSGAEERHEETDVFLNFSCTCLSTQARFAPTSVAKQFVLTRRFARALSTIAVSGAAHHLSAFRGKTHCAKRILHAWRLDPLEGSSNPVRDDPFRLHTCVLFWNQFKYLLYVGFSHFGVVAAFVSMYRFDILVCHLSVSAIPDRHTRDNISSSHDSGALIAPPLTVTFKQMPQLFAVMVQDVASVAATAARAAADSQ